MALNKRETKNHVRLIWNLFDRKHNGVISNHDIAVTSLESGGNIGFSDARRIIENCSFDGHAITFNEFYQLMTRPKGMPVHKLDYVVQGRKRQRKEKTMTMLGDSLKNTLNVSKNKSVPLYR